MPLVLWPVQPKFLYRNNVIENSNAVLESQRVHALCNIHRQLASISLNVEEIFSGIVNNMELIEQKSENIANRIQNIYDFMKKNNNNTFSHAESTPKDWKIEIKIGDPTVARETIPEPIEKLYNNCEPIPAIERFDKFQVKGIKSKDYYSRPEFFFEQWLVSFDQAKSSKGAKKRKSKDRRRTTLLKEDRNSTDYISKVPAPTTSQSTDKAKPSVTKVKKDNKTDFSPKNQNLRTLYKAAPSSSIVDSDSYAIIETHDDATYPEPDKTLHEIDSAADDDDEAFKEINSEDDRVSFQKEPALTDSYAAIEPSQVSPDPDIESLPAPRFSNVFSPTPSPSPTLAAPPSLVAPPPVAVPLPSPPMAVPPPPPPVAVPPPPPPIAAPPLPGADDDSPLPSPLFTSPVLEKKEPPPARAGGAVDLLSSIRAGKKLKTVEVEVKQNVDDFGGNSVASILARRMQVAGDSDEDSDEEDDGDEDDWN